MKMPAWALLIIMLASAVTVFFCLKELKTRVLPKWPW